MSVALKLTWVQNNDAKAIQFTDDTGEYDASTNTGGWGAPNEVVADIVATTTTTTSKYHLTLDITSKDKDLNEVTYDTIDLYSEFTSEFSKTHGMDFLINSTHLKESGVAIGDADDTLIDGVYTATYKIKEADTATVVYTITYSWLVDGVVRIAVYESLNTVPEIYDCKIVNNDNENWKNTQDPLFAYSYFQGMLAYPDLGRLEDKLSQLDHLYSILNI